MGNIYRGMEELIGKTPLLEVNRLAKSEALEARILVKLELFNPAGSVKDRAALSMILDAEEKGIIKKGATIIEPTSGNTGIGIASIAAARGYKAILTMPETMSIERRKLLQAYGAQIVLTEGKLGMKGAIAKAEELAKETKNAVVLGQFDNMANVMAHEKTTAPEIWDDTDGVIDIFVAGAGTGGTISGVGHYIKEKGKETEKEIRIVAVEPEGSSIMSGGNPGPHGLQGIGAGFIPSILDREVIDEVVTVKEEDAYLAVHKLAEKEGVLVGISSGAALYAAMQLASKKENSGKTIVVLLPDTGERYLSTPLFD